MHRLLIACLAIAILFCLLCGPAWYVALRLWRRGDLDAFRPLRAVWVTQVLLACGLVFGADTLQLPQPAVWLVAIFCSVSLGGAALFGAWRLARGLATRRLR
jgi:hypothetical protein